MPSSRLVELALARQPALTAPDPPKFWAVLDEAALHRQVGGPEAMRRQLEHLLELAELPNVAIISFDHLRAVALSFADSVALIAEIIGSAAFRPGADAAEIPPPMAWSAASAEAATNEDNVAGALDRMARQRPDDSRLRARSTLAKSHAARPRKRAEDLRRNRQSGTE